MPIDRRAETKILFVLGAAGFMGQEVVKQALAQGWMVRALVRDLGRAGLAACAGLELIEGTVERPETWAERLSGADCVIDLVQPAVPARLGFKQVTRMSQQRQQLTSQLLQVLKALPEEVRPVLLNISGVDDLQPDASQRVTAASGLAQQLQGFGHIGLPVRRLVEQSRVAAIYVYLGTVYGPGKLFAELIFPRLKAGSWKLIGSGQNHLAMIQLEDAAAGLLHLAAETLTERKQALLGKNFVLTDGSQLTQSAFFGLAAQLIGQKAPGRVPGWLAGLLAGPVLVETMMRDARVESFWGNENRSKLKYPDPRLGLIQSLTALGYLPDGMQSQASGADALRAEASVK